MVEVIYLKDFGTSKKGDEKSMYPSTAKGLINAKIVKLKNGKDAGKEEK